MTSISDFFSEVWAVDFEYRAQEGNLPDMVVCMVAKELKSNRTIQLWLDELYKLSEAPFKVDGDSCVVAYNALAELACFKVLGWREPENIIDLYPEFRNICNGLTLPNGRGLLGALSWYGIESISVQSKEDYRSLILENAEYTSEQKNRILAYCESDVIALEKLLPRIESHPIFRLEFALLRGRYMKALSKIEATGIPIDAKTYQRILNDWQTIRCDLIEAIDKQYGVYKNGSFSTRRFLSLIKSRGLEWRYSSQGTPSLDDETFKERTTLYPELNSLRELRNLLSKFRSGNRLVVGMDKRNRASLWAFNSVTGRNQPSTTKFIFGQPKFMRFLIEPPLGNGLAYIDWKQQEFGIAAALSCDQNMKEAYKSGDPYLGFGILAGLIPPDATKDSHPVQREKFKELVISVQYQMGVETLAHRLGNNTPIWEAQNLLDLHKTTFSQFWKWSDAALDFAQFNGKIYTAFGWYLNVTSSTKLRTIRNFPMQANGAEMMRLACIFAVEDGVRICAPVHDALLIEAPTEMLDEMIAKTQAAMRKASMVVLDGFSLGTDVYKVVYPDRYFEKKGETVWNTIMRLLEEKDRRRALLAGVSEQNC